MKKIFDFIIKYWKRILEVIGITALVAFILEQLSGNKGTIPDLNLSKLDKEIDDNTKKKIIAIKSTANADIKKVDAQTTDEALSSLSPEAKAQIDKLKGTNVLGDLN